MIVRPWTIGDTERIQLQPAQEYLGRIVDICADFTELANQGLAWTIEHDDDVIAFVGFEPQWQNRATAFALLSESAGAHLPAIHKFALRLLESVPYRRIEATVDVGFKQGHRWVKMLGFEIEGYMRAYRPDGADMLLYARVR
jgi:RimJ/RimL family protein N-acetyltransferase